MKEKKDNKKIKAAKAAAVTVAAAGVVTGTLFDSPTELVPELTQNAVVEEVLEDSDDDGAVAPEEKKRGPLDRFKGWILELPEAVRMLVGLPLWAVGWVLMTGVSALVGTAAVPVERVVSWLCLSAILLTVFAFSVKSAFPELPVRQILRGRNIFFISVAALVLGLADLALPTVWAGYDFRTQLVWRAGATCLLVFVCVMALSRHGKVTIEVEHEPTEEEIRAEARRLADSVAEI